LKICKTQSISRILSIHRNTSCPQTLFGNIALASHLIATAANSGSFAGRWWRIAGGISMNLAFGSIYAWSVFVAPLERHFGWKRADTSMIFTIAIFMTGFTFLLSGWIYDRWGPSFSAFAGGALASLGFFLSSFSHTLPELFLYFGVIGGLGSGLGCAVIISVLAKWFPDKRGLAMGLIVGAYATSSGIFGPLAEAILIPNYGFATTFKILGGIFFAMTMTGALLLKDPPRNYQPAGWKGESSRAAPSSYQFTTGEMLQTPAFYLMWLAYTFGCASGLMVISQLIPYVRSRGMTGPSSAIMFLVLGAAANTLGRVLSGWMSDTVGRLTILRLMIGASAVAMPVLYADEAHIALLYAAMIVVYFCYGTQLSVNAASCADFWGVKNIGLNHGLLFTAWGVAGVIGPRIGGVLYDRYHNYRSAFYTAAILATFGLLFESFARSPQPPLRSSLTFAKTD
jgi:OFA family oxalate/formate antiporter-like MFS transporter